MISKEEIHDWLNKDEGEKYQILQAKGGIEGLAELLETDLQKGLDGDAEDIARRKELYGENKFSKVKMVPFWRLWYNAWNDEMMKILTVAAFVALILGVAFPEEGERGTGWIDGAAILAAIVIVCTVTAVNDYSQERQFQKLNEKQQDRQVTVIRKGQQTKISIHDVVVGDLVNIGTGEALPADGVYVSGFALASDESSMTGESIDIHKTAEVPFMLSGCPITEGSGSMVAIAVGVESAYGQLLSRVTDVEREETPLQIKLGVLARNIGYIGLAVAIVVFIVLMVYWVIDRIRFGFEFLALIEILDYFIIAVTIIVVAVPEGLPLAVTIALAYSMKKMMKDKNLVRRLRACETMGGCTTICSDKTGTLTMNKMSVVKGYAGGVFDSVPVGGLGGEMQDLIIESICGNLGKTTSITDDPEKPGIPQFNGSATECALLLFVESFGVDYVERRGQVESTVVKVIPFSSDRKRMSSVVKLPNGKFRMFTKGAAEVVLERCTHIMNGDGSVSTLDSGKRDELTTLIGNMADEALRNIVIAYRDFDVFDTSDDVPDEEDEQPEQKLTFLGLTGIQDPLRPEVPNAVKLCQNAGIIVRMVTGDHKDTAVAIARQCGILTDGTVLEGGVFREMSDEELDPILDNLQVLARSKPDDKLRLVRLLRERKKQLVAVTGDGANDAPALRNAHVGLAMGITGTDIAKEASDIIITDDNFNSIVKSVMWGRSIFDNIRKFLQFQLTVNVAALAIAFFGAVLRIGTPLKAIQLLWVNLIMDSMGALALATEPPTEKLLQRPPINVSHEKTRLISNRMWATILGQSAYQVGILLILVWAVPIFYDVVPRSDHHFTIIFNAFVFCQIFNEVSSRKVNGEINCFEGLHKNYMFIAVIIITVIAQIIIVEGLGLFFHTVPLPIDQWILCVIIGAVGMINGFFLRAIPLPADKLYSSTSQDDLEAPEDDELLEPEEKTLD
mmetsp:Transcript_16662/g.65069  ORF Transcript_16662/g.65069 Transcript_16662/m.65069 type:complete len:960 (+) Transcript_16662:147-3026(+)|eukprot:CAMPEP_0114617332 /NCGR_PEP_ID=MMETSP0168-20121206/7144_1 /TAXON_ID=95228 ORGANISM="Vannella sp., Strain DIVA3 517/6/12" /NCGR_SAMPLE_ID=MMETSP0168 /ASSEMBLY_ACC=CAM_ASM_000044 /LENGTH=959 /DNA_ID=CAMNT_0001828467 /DNA_START=70 /DNA_END=2949 /DNA_ORIENTATION=+